MELVQYSKGYRVKSLILQNIPDYAVAVPVCFHIFSHFFDNLILVSPSFLVRFPWVNPIYWSLLEVLVGTC